MVDTSQKRDRNRRNLERREDKQARRRERAEAKRLRGLASEAVPTSPEDTIAPAENTSALFPGRIQA